MDSIVQKLLDQKYFDAFIQNNMKLSTYVAEWKSEMNPEWTATKVYTANLAEYAAAMVGSVIDKNGEKPTHVMPSLNQLMGAIGHMGDEWQMDNERLDQFYQLEGRYHDKQGSYTAEQRTAEYRNLIKFLFDPYEKAVIAPQKRIDMLYFEGLFNGTQTVSRTNNVKANVSYTYDLGIKKFQASVARWGEENSTPLDDIQAVDDWARAHGKVIMKVRMSKATFRKMCKSAQFIKSFKIKLAKADITPTTALSVTDVNTYLESLMMPTISIEKDRFVTLADGKTTNLTVDDRVVFQCADRIAVLKVADPLESVDPLPNKTYSTVDYALIGNWRDKHGRFVDYDMWATPVFNGKDDYYILETDKTA